LKESIVVDNYRFLIEGLINQAEAPGGDANEEIKRKRAFGSVMGAFVGDAAGAVLEFYN
jgi:hypothetical protein